MSERQKKLAPYVQALPGILQYQLFTKLVLGVWLFLMGRIFRMLLNSTNRVAVSSGDILYQHSRCRPSGESEEEQEIPASDAAFTGTFD